MFLYEDDKRHPDSIKHSIYHYKDYIIENDQYGNTPNWIILDKNLKKLDKEPEKRLKDCKAYIDKLLGETKYPTEQTNCIDDCICPYCGYKFDG